MKFRLFIAALNAALLCLVLAVSPAGAGSMMLLGVGKAGTGSCTPGTEASAFFTRVSAASITLDANHTAVYCNMINGLVADGVWTKLDVLFFFSTNAATGSAATLSLLNLKSSSFTGTLSGTPTFTADQGYTGTDNSINAVISNFNPSTAGGSFAQNSAHISVWSNTNVTTTSGGIAAGNSTTSGSNNQLFPRFNDGKAYYRINDANGASAPGITTADSIGFYLANRSAASGTTSLQGYKNAVDQGVVAGASGTLTNQNLTILANDVEAGAIGSGFAGQISCASIGGNLSSTDVTNLFNRLATARTAVGL